jgi:hypothetical protein
MRIEDVFETKSVQDTVESVVRVLHIHDITQLVSVLQERTDLGTASAQHVGTEI